MRLSNIRKGVLSDQFPDSYPEEWPPYEYYLSESKITREDFLGLKELVENNSGETDIDRYITERPQLLLSVLDMKNTGHHAAWVIPKQQIKPHVSSEMRGLIPDFLVGGKNSFGVTWYIVELKGANHKLFSMAGGSVKLSDVANKGFCQSLIYMQFCNSSQHMLREVLKLKGFDKANSFLIVGRAAETNTERERMLKSAVNNFSESLSIRSYDSFLSSCERIVDSNSRM
ncbi:DUF4263 domain-containing protein [Vreelandella venusta]|uniref:Shedu anti-phage system protein SduA domain-containing protein n=1 Tax=Vreelandella venusta TaxID=44935 RepID=UPI003850BAA8